MATNTEKHINFVSEPMGEKVVSDLPGIDEDLGQELESKGFHQAYVLLGQYLILKQDEDKFVDWMVDLCPGANQKRASRCFQCLKEWCEQFL